MMMIIFQEEYVGAVSCAIDSLEQQNNLLNHKNLRIAKDFSGKVRTPFPADPILLQKPPRRIASARQGRENWHLSSVQEAIINGENYCEVSNSSINPPKKSRGNGWARSFVPFFFGGKHVGFPSNPAGGLGVPSAPYELAVAVNLEYYWVEEDRT